MKESTTATSFEPHECVIFVQSTKICTDKNKAIHNKRFWGKNAILNFGNYTG